MDHLISTYGYWAIFALVALECVGVPIPGETIVIAAGTYAGHTHRLSVWAIWAVASAAAFIGSSVGFAVGQFGGYRLLRRYGHYVRLNEPRIKVGRYVFDRYGWTVVLFGRFVGVLRAYTALLAGTSRMRVRSFMVFNALGAVAWAAVYSFGSYAVGNSLRHEVGTVGIVLGAAAVVAIVAVVIVVRRHAGRLTVVAEAAYPGPLPD
jgi:membrane protein DedA with SNARE-associated domain